MNWTKNPNLPRRSIRSALRKPHWKELFAWLLAGLVIEILTDIDAGSTWRLALGCIVLAAMRTGLLRWLAVLQRQD